MRKIGLEELKKIQIEILDVVASFCQKKKINYWLDCGTLIGAVRHKGYIPWDDDIDIGMLREDYNRFLREFNEENIRYKVYSVENNPHFCFQFAKILDTETELYEPNREDGVRLCINIDLFVYDNAPLDDQECKKMFKKRDFYKKMRLAQLYPKMFDHKSIVKKIMRFFLNLYLKFLPKNYYTQKMVSNSKKYVNKKTNRVGNFMSATAFVADKKIFKKFCQVEFEGKKYMAPIGYDEWLRNIYGDYMKLPPEEKRVSQHFFEAYIKDEEEE